MTDVRDPSSSSAADERPAPSREAPGLREHKKRQARLAMHRAAIELVAEHGYAGVTVEMIAREAGVSTRTFFNYWATKDAAILGVLTGESDAMLVRLREELAHQGVRAALITVIRENLEAMPSDPELRALKKSIMASEPRLHSMSAGNMISVQADMAKVVAETLDGDDARARGVLAVQICFAMTRSAFAISAYRGTDLATAFDDVLALYDAGGSGF